MKTRGWVAAVLRESRSERLLVLLACAFVAWAQQGSVRALGTVTAVQPGEFTFKTDAGESLTVKPSEKTRVQRVNPGERDLSKAEPMRLEDMATGDRVLVRGSRTENVVSADSVIVMAAKAIAQRNEVEQRAWRERGVFGSVDTVDPEGKSVKLSVRTQADTHPVTVVLTDKTSIRRYKPDSIRFADAVPATLADMRKGDQLRALGNKDESGSRIDAEQVVFGTFRTVAGTVTDVSSTDGTVTMKDVQTNKTLTVRTKSDTQLKKFGLPGGGEGMRAGAAGAGGPGRIGSPAGAPTAAGGEPRAGSGGFGRAGDMSAMLERMPAIKLEELKAGDTVIVSSTSGAKPDELTAIVLVAGAEPIIAQLRARSEARAGQDPMAAASSLDRSLEGMIGMPIQ